MQLPMITENLLMTFVLCTKYYMYNVSDGYEINLMIVMIDQWENLSISLPVLSAALVQFPVMAEYFKGFFLG